jgi:multiple sugar transport system substrate-binding protein
VIRLSKSARVAAFVGVVALSGAALTACSSASTSSGTASTVGGTYTWWDPYPQHDASSDWAKRVDACGTAAGVTIKRTGYDTTALTNQALLSAQEGTSPDVILLDNPAVSTLADTGTLNTTEGLGIDTSGIDKNLLAAGVINQKTYGIPIGANTLALYYNKTILDAAGVDPATITNWASLNAALAKVTAAGHKGITFAGIGTEEGSFQFLPWFWGAGADLKHLDSTQATDALTLWTTWLSKGYAPNSVITNSQNTTWEDFLTGTYAFGENGTWQVDSAVKAGFPTGVIQIPAENGGAAPTPTGGEFITIPVQKVTARYTTTKKIVDCMTTTDGQVKTATTFAYYIPPTAAGQAQLLSQDPSLKLWVDAVKSAKGRTSDNLGTSYPKISQPMWTAVQKALSGSLSPKAALAEAQQAAAKATS